MSYLKLLLFIQSRNIVKNVCIYILECLVNFFCLVACSTVANCIPLQLTFLIKDKHLCLLLYSLFMYNFCKLYIILITWLQNKQ